MYYIIGLGNPGEQYTDTPHNIGYELVEQLRAHYPYDFGDFAAQNKQMVAKGVVSGAECVLVKPTTYMNKSGEIFGAYDNVDPEKVIVIYDDIDLPFGTVKLSRDRGSGGHNGIKSIEQHLKTRTFIRFRVGVCPLDWFGNPRKPQGRGAVERYLVHKKLSRRYTKEYDNLVVKIAQHLENIIDKGYSHAVSVQGR